MQIPPTKKTFSHNKLIFICFLQKFFNKTKFYLSKLTYSKSILPIGMTIGSKSVIFPSAKFHNLHSKIPAITIGDYTFIRGELSTFWQGGKISVGDYCYIGDQTRIWSAVEITIGNRVLISHNVNIFDNDTHPIDSPEARHRQFCHIIFNTYATAEFIPLNERPITIKDDVLIGCNSIILAGVTIGEGAVVGAGSIVTKDVPPYTLVAGNPAHFIRSL